MTNPPLNEEEWAGWKQHPATQALMRWAAGEVAQAKEQWASGQFTDQSQFGTAMLNAKAIGRCEAFGDLADLDYEQVIGESNEHVRAESPRPSGAD